MSKLLSDEEMEKELDVILEYDGDHLHHNTKSNILDLINTQKRLFAESIIGEDDEPRNTVEHSRRNFLRAEQREKIK